MEKVYEKGGFEAMTASGNADNIRGETSINNANTSSGNGTNPTRENRKRKEREESSSEAHSDGEDDSQIRKKKRVIWTSEMHQKFLDAIAQIGPDRAFPKKIVEVMNEPGLTRENVASHLQDLSIEDLEKVYEKGGFEAMTVSGNADNIRGETSNKANTSSGDGTNLTRENRKRKEREESSSEAHSDGEDDSQVQKKKRVIWTSEMHQKFLDAIAQIGPDRAFPKKIVEVMNEPGLTRENVASHLQKYRICLKKSQEVMDKYHSLGNFQQHYLGSSQLASGNYLSVSSSSNFLNYGIGTSIGASRVRLAPPSYSSFDVSSLRINTGNVQNQYNQRTEVTNYKSFGTYGNEERNRLLSIMNRRPSTTPDDHAAITSTTNSAFMGLRIASDGKSILFGGSDRSEIVTSENNSTTRNDFHCQESSSQMFPSFNIVEDYAQGPPVPQFADSNTGNHLGEPSLPPLPEIYVESPLSQLGTVENDPSTFIPQWETPYGTNLQTEDIYSLSSGQNSTSSDQQNFLQTLPWETLESAGMDMSSQIYANNQATTSLSPWHPNSYTASYPLNTNLINQEDSLPPLPSDVPLDFYPDSTTLNPIPQVTDEQSLLPSIPLESQWNVNSDASSVPGGNNSLDQQSLLPPLPSEIPWNLDPDSVPQPNNGNFFDEQNFMSPSLSEPQDAFQELSSHHVNMW